MNPSLMPLSHDDPTHFGGWKLLGRLGKGGYSTIFLGEKDGTLSAIKMIRKELLSEPNVFERFATEINSLEKLSHPGIAKIIEEDLSTEVPYIAMEYIKGQSLEQYVNENGPLGESEWLDTLESVAASLDYCHSMGIIHKDIGPGNIMMSDVGPKLIDFGISYELGNNRITQDDQIVGTPSYMSPEHLTGQVSPSMDLFSLGSTFVFAGTGFEPFEAPTKSQTRTSITFEMPRLQGLSETQKSLITPLLYKLIEHRPTIKDLLLGINSLREGGNLGAYALNSRGASKKLSAKKINLKRQRQTQLISRAGIAAILILLIAFTGFSLLSKSEVDVMQSSGSIKLDSAQTSALGGTKDALNTDGLSVRDPQGLSGQCATLYLAHDKRALETCKSASDLGDDRSTYYAGAIYRENGNDKMAATYYKKAVGGNPDDTKSMEGLVQIYLDAKDTANYSKWVKTCALYEIKTTAGARCKLLYGMDLIKAGDEKAGTAFLSDALDWGESSAASYLGAYFNDRGKTDKAIFWLTKSAELGDPTGLKMLQDLTYSSGQFDIWKKWTLKSAEDGNIKDIGKYALYAVISDKDYDVGKKWGARGAQEDDPLSMFALGYSYWKADRDLVNAKKWLTKSANLKSELAIRTLGDIYRSEKDYLNSAIWYAKGADLGDFTSSYFASLIYFAGLNDVATSCKYVNISINLADSESKTRKLNDEEKGRLVEIQDLKSNICK